MTAALIVIVFVIFVLRSSLKQSRSDNARKRAYYDFLLVCRYTELSIHASKTQAELVVVFWASMVRLKSYKRLVNSAEMKKILSELWAMFYNRKALLYHNLSKDERKLTRINYLSNREVIIPTNR